MAALITRFSSNLPTPPSDKVYTTISHSRSQDSNKHLTAPAIAWGPPDIGRVVHYLVDQGFLLG